MNKSPNASDCAINLLSSPRSTKLNNSSPCASLNQNFRSRSVHNEFIRTVLEDCVKEWFSFLKDDSMDVEESNENKNTLCEKIIKLQSYSIGVKSPEIPLERLYKSDRNISHLNADNEDEDLFYNSYNIYKSILNETSKEENNNELFPDDKRCDKNKGTLAEKIKTEIYDEENKKKESDTKEIEKELKKGLKREGEIENIKALQKEKTAVKENDKEQGAVIKNKKVRGKEEREEEKEIEKEHKNKKGEFEMLHKERDKNKTEYYNKYKLEQITERGTEKEKGKEREIIYNEQDKREKLFQEHEREKMKPFADNKEKSSLETPYIQFNKDNRKYKEVKKEKPVENEEEKKKWSVKENQNVNDINIEKNIIPDKKKTSKVLSTEKNDNGEFKAIQKKSVSKKNTLIPVEQKRNKTQTVSQDSRSINEIIAEIKEEESKLQNVKMEQYGNSYMNICMTVLKENINVCCINSQFSAEELKNEKKKIKEILKLYDKLFYAHFKFTPSKFYKESLRPIYTYYQNLKQHISQVENENTLAERKLKNSTATEKKEQPQMKDATSVNSSVVYSSSTSNINGNSKDKEKERGKEISKSQSSSTIIRSSSSVFANLINDPTIHKIIVDVDTCEDISHLEKDFKYIYKDLVKLKNLLIKKKYYKTILFNYQNQFLEKNNRCVKTYKDIYPVEKEYKMYTQLNKEISEMIKCINVGYKKYYLTAV